MIEIKKAYNLKIVSILITLVFCLNSLVYGMDIDAKTHLRPRLVFDPGNEIKDSKSYKSLADILKHPKRTPRKPIKRAKAIVMKEKEILGFLGVKRSQISSIRYEIEQREDDDTDSGYVLKYILDTKSGQITFYAKLKHPKPFVDFTELERKMTLAASQAEAFPPSTVIADTLIIRGIDNGISLEEIPPIGNSEWVDFFLENEKHFVKEIGKAYGRLNKIAGISHVDVERRHIFITKDKRVYLIDVTPSSETGPLSSQWGEHYPKDFDLKRLTKYILRDLAISLFAWDTIFQPIGIQKKVKLYAQKIQEKQEEYAQWLQEGYDEIEEAKTPLIDSIDIRARKEWQTPGNPDLFAYQFVPKELAITYTSKMRELYKIFSRRYKDTFETTHINYFLNHFGYTQIFTDIYNGKHINVLDSLISEDNELLFRMFNVAVKDIKLRHNRGSYTCLLRYPKLVDEFKLNIQEILKEKRALQERKVTVLIPGCASGEEMVTWKWVLETELKPIIPDFDDFEFEFVGIDNNYDVYKEAQSKLKYGFDIFSALELKLWASTVIVKQDKNEVLNKLAVMNHVNGNLAEYRKDIKIIFGDIASENFRDILENSDLVIMNSVLYQVKGRQFDNLVELFRSVSESRSSMRIIGKNTNKLKILQESL